MAHPRRLPRFTTGSRVPIRLSTAQRDLFLGSAALPQGLGHALHRAPVREGKLNVHASQVEIDTLIAIAAKARPSDRSEERSLDALLRYLEGISDRFAPAVEDADAETA